MHPEPLRSRSRSRALAAILLLALGSPLRASAEPPAVQPPADTPALPEPTDYQAPDPAPTPAGAPADQALWKRAMDDSNGLTTVKAAASRLQWQARNGKYGERLAAQAKGLGGAEAAARQELARRLQAAWVANNELASSRWPVDPTRGCQYQAQLLESAMNMSDGPDKSASLVPARAEVARCAELAESVVRQMTASNDEFRKVLAEADAALATPSR